MGPLIQPNSRGLQPAKIVCVSHAFSRSTCITESIGLNLEVPKEQLTGLISYQFDPSMQLQPTES